jgi:ubiquinone/menaquinone biosynthesis C-methylase UbiE
MERILEPELMDDEQQSVAYAQADFSASNQFFVDSLVRDFPAHLHTILDIGCGPADVVIRLARSLSRATIVALDGSAPMLSLAQAAVSAAGLDHRITLLQTRIPGPPPPAQAFDTVLSKDLLHHLPEPGVLWTEVTRVGQPGAAVCVMDLMRPATPEAARAMVKDHAGSDSPILQRDFYNSLLAAFTVDEVREQLAVAGLNFQVAAVSNRHMLITGTLR